MAAYKPILIVAGKLQQIQTGNNLVGPDGTTEASLFLATSPIHGFASLATAGIVVKTDANGGVTTRALTSTGTLSFTNADGVAGSPIIDVAANVVLPGTGSVTIPSGTTAQQPVSVAGAQLRYDTTTNELRWSNGTTWQNISSTTGTVTSVNISSTTSGITVGGGPITSSGTLTVNLNSELQAISQIAGTGLIARTGAATYAEVTITGTTNQIDVVNGNGSGAPTISISSNYVGQASITTLGTIGTGTWNGSTIAVAHGGTGQTTAAAAFNALSPITTTGDLIVGTGVNTAGRLGVGTAGQLLTVVGGVPAWTAPATNGTVTSITVTAGTGMTVDGISSATISSSGTFALALNGNLQSLSGLSSTGMVVQTGPNTFTNGSITGTVGRIVIGGTVAAPTIDLATVINSGTGTFLKLATDGYGRVTGTTAVVAADITSLVDATYVNVSGDTMTGNLAMGGHEVTGLPTTPSGATAATSKAYVDALVTSSVSWRNPIVDPDINNVVNVVPVSPVLGATYIAYGGTYPQNWGVGATAVASGDVVTWNEAGTAWIVIKNLAAGDRFLIAGEHGTISAALLTAGFFSKDLIQYVAGNPGLTASWTFPEGRGFGGVPQIASGITVLDSNVNSQHYGHTYMYGQSGNAWIEISGPGAINAGIGLSYSGNTLNVLTGAGLTQLPGTEVGVDLRDSVNGAIILTTDGTTRSTVTGSQLHLLLDGAGGLAQTASGLKISASGVTNVMLANSSITLDGDASAGTIALGGTMSIFGTSNRLTTSVTAGTYTLDISSNYVGQASITTLGTIGTGTWNGSTIAVAHGGTGLATVPTNGQLLIGNGTSYTQAVLTAGTGISVVDGAGSITINNTGVTSVSLSAPSIFTVSTPTVTTTGTLTFTLASQSANTVLAAPNGLAGTPTFRSLVATDIPSLSTLYLNSVTVSGGTTGLTAGIATPGSQTITLSGTLNAVNGGTGQSVYTVGDILYASTTTALSKLAVGAAGTVLKGGTTPTYAAVNLTADVTGTLPVANGGTGHVSVTANSLLLGNGASALNVLSPGVAGQVLTMVAGAPTWTSSSSSEVQFANSQGTTISLGNAVYVKSDGTVALADANVAGTSIVIGLVADASIANLASGNIALSGIVSGLSGLTPGATYFLSDVSAGVLTATAPTSTGSYVAEVGVAISATAIKINVQPTILL